MNTIQEMEKAITERFNSSFREFNLGNSLAGKPSKCVFCGDTPLSRCPLCAPFEFFSVEELIGSIEELQKLDLPADIIVALASKDIFKKPIDLFFKDYAHYCFMHKVAYGRNYSPSAYINAKDFAVKYPFSDKKRDEFSPFYKEEPENVSSYKRAFEWQTTAKMRNKSAYENFIKEHRTHEQRLTEFKKTSLSVINNDPNWFEHAVRDSSKGNSLVTLAKVSSFWPWLSDPKLKDVRIGIGKYLQNAFGAQSRIKEQLPGNIDALLEFNRIPKTLAKALENDPALFLYLDKGFAKTWNFKLSNKMANPSSFEIYKMSILGAGNWNENAAEFLMYVLSHNWHLPFQSDLCTFLRKHINKVNHKSLVIISREWENDWLPKDISPTEMLSVIELKQANGLWEQVFEKVGRRISFRQSELRCTIYDNTKDVTISNIAARVLHPTDRKQVLLGDLTACCQSLGDAGEASMMEGLVNPDSGFLVFERKYETLAQAWIWLSEDGKTLVLDNIEFSNDREVDSIRGALRAWCEQAPYADIQMGTGWNQIDSIGEAFKTICNADGDRVYVDSEGTEHTVPWYEQCWDRKYTDANKRRWLKREDKMRF